MRALWKGTISFGLVSIPVSLFPATRREELKFHLLRRSDLSPINYKRIAEADGKEVPWDQVVKGYEYEKGKYVVLKEEDFARIDVEATQTVDIVNFVDISDVDPLLFYKPYYLESSKAGDKAYVLLPDALVESRRIAIATVVIRKRQHLAAVKPQKKGLILETGSRAYSCHDRTRRLRPIWISFSRTTCLALMTIDLILPPSGPHPHEL